MSTVNKKRVRILSTISSDSDDVDQGNPKTHENGGKMRILGDNKAGDTENVVKSNTCSVCDGKDNWVFICYEEECPIAIHQSCASDEPDFDEFGNFYCPYCWYKRVVLKCVELGKKLMVSDKSRKGCRETLGGVDLGLMMDKETEDVENVGEVNVSGGRTLASVSSSGKRRKGDGSDNKGMVMEKNQKMKEVVPQTHSGGNTKNDDGDADVDEGRERRGRFNEKNHETSDACFSNADERRKGRVRGSAKNHGMVQVRNSDVGEEREQQRRCNDINHETEQAHLLMWVSKQESRGDTVKINQQNKRIAGTHEQDVFINDEGTQAHDFELGEGRSGQGCCHENNLQKKASSTKSCEQEVPRTDNRTSNSSGLGEGKYRLGRHIEKNRHNETVETETQEKEVSKDGERKRERGVERGRTITNVNPSGSRREGHESNKKCIVMEKSQKMKVVAAETHSQENSKADDTDSDQGRKKQGRFNEKNYETSDACISNAGEGRKGSLRGSEKNHEAAQAHIIDVGGERKRQRRCDDINHETAHPHSFVVGVKTKEKRRYSEKKQQNKKVAGTHEQDVFINDEGTQAHNSDLGDGRSGLGCCHENNQQKKVSSTERCEQEVPRSDKRVSHGSGLGEGRYLEGRHIEKNQLTETIETETQVKKVPNDRKRKREQRVERDGDEFDLAENQDRHCQPDMRNDDVAFNKQEIGFSKDEQVERKSVLSISSPESTNNVKVPNVASQELALIIHPKAGVQERPIEARPLNSVPSKKPSFQPEKYGHKSYMEKNRTASNDPGQRKYVFCSDKKRKRLFWTQAEEEMLRVGVQKFPGVRNIPWRKILGFGRDVFHDERAPSDLKDKWKTMNKMPSDTGKRILSTERQPNYYVSEVNSE